MLSLDVPDLPSNFLYPLQKIYLGPPIILHFFQLPSLLDATNDWDSRPHKNEVHVLEYYYDVQCISFVDNKKRQTDWRTTKPVTQPQNYL